MQNNTACSVIEFVSNRVCLLIAMGIVLSNLLVLLSIFISVIAYLHIGDCPVTLGRMSFEIQRQIKNNAQDLREYVKNLHEWEEEMEAKEASNKLTSIPQQPLESKHEQQPPPPPPRHVELVRDSNSVQDYYQAWDQYDPDEEIKRLEEEEAKAYRPYNPYENSKSNQRAKPRTKMTIKGNRNVIVRDPNSLKQKGNLHFQVGEYERAIDCYSECLVKLSESEHGSENASQPAAKDLNKLKAVVLSNRAMAYIKVNERAKALEDCNESLKYNDEYTKTYLRRADCLKRLGRYKESLSDYKSAKSLAPSEPQADIEIKKIQAYVALKVKQTHDNMIVRMIPEPLPGGYRLEIDEVEDFESQDEHKDSQSSKEQVINYLEQL